MREGGGDGARSPTEKVIHPLRRSIALVYFVSRPLLLMRASLSIHLLSILSRIAAGLSPRIHHVTHRPIVESYVVLQHATSQLTLHPQRPGLLPSSSCLQVEPSRSGRQYGPSAC